MGASKGPPSPPLRRGVGWEAQKESRRVADGHAPELFLAVLVRGYFLSLEPRVAFALTAGNNVRLLILEERVVLEPERLRLRERDARDRRHAFNVRHDADARLLRAHRGRQRKIGR